MKVVEINFEGISMIGECIYWNAKLNVSWYVKFMC